MVVAQPPHPPATAPFRCDNHYIELVCWFDLEPFLSTRPDGIVARQELCHETLVSRFKREFPERLALPNFSRYDSSSNEPACSDVLKYPPTFGGTLTSVGPPSTRTPPADELVLESGSIRVLCENLLSIVCHLCQRGFDWDEQAKIDPFHGRCAPRHSQASNVADIAVQHVCSTNYVSRHS